MEHSLHVISMGIHQIDLISVESLYDFSPIFNVLLDYLEIFKFITNRMVFLTYLEF